MPATNISVTDSRAGTNLPLTTVALGFKQSEFVMKYLFPLVQTPTYGGTVIQFDDSDYEEINDDRADESIYPEINMGYAGQPYKLDTKGISFPLGDKRRKEMENLNINWGVLATRTMVNRAGLKHEIEAAAIATTVGNYATTNRVTLASGSRFNNVDPDPIIRTGMSAVAGQIGVTPNVMVLGQEVFDVLAGKYAANFTSTNTTPGLRAQLTEETLANIYGLEHVKVCRAVRRVQGSAASRVFGKSLVLARVNPAALSNADLMLTYRPQGGDLISLMEPSFGYTYVMQNHPQVSNPIRDELRSRTVWKLDFDRKVVATGVNASSVFTHGYLINTAVD